MGIDSLRLLLEKCHDPYLNLSIEEAILNQVNEGTAPDTLRLWTNTASIIIGSGQKSASLDLGLCLRKGIHVVRRMTGGGTVYHDEGNLNWSFTLRRLDHSQTNITSAYCNLGSLIAESLNNLGIHAYFVNPNRIDVDSRKISGMAGRFKSQAFVIHGTLLVNSDLELLNQLCPVIVDAPPVTSLERIVNRQVEVETVVQMITGFLQRKGINLSSGDLSPDESESAGMLYTQKYSLLTWNIDHRWRPTESSSY